MRIAIVGTGYVGLVTGACFSDMGNDVWCVDIDKAKIDYLNEGGIPIYEPGLEEIVKRNKEAGRLKFTTSIEEVLKYAKICFIAVGTPMGDDGSADLKYVLDVAKSIGKFMVHPMLIVDKSTVPVGTAKKVRDAVQGKLDIRKSDLTFSVVSNPEFLKEGTAIHDSMRPDRIVIGVDSHEAQQIMFELYRHFVPVPEKIIIMDIASAEMTKYTANSMLATKISFINEISNICELVGADVNKVRLGIGSDGRIGYSFIYAGCGYGGSCFPKDVQALIRTSENYGYRPQILEAVEKVNNDQKLLIPQKVVKRFGEDLSGRTFCCWGLAFKPDTDDMRMAASIVIINELTKRGAQIKAYDPKATKEARNCYLKDNNKVIYCNDKYEALKDCDAMILVTEWKEFRSPDFERIIEMLKQPVIFDGRNQYDSNFLTKMGIEYYQIGVGETTLEWMQ